MSFESVVVDWYDWNIWISALWIILLAVFWNMVARVQHQHQVVSRLFGSQEVGCNALACLIFLLSLYRNWRFLLAIGSQTKWELMKQNWILWTGHTCVILGFIFVITSFTYLGLSACYMGDYFGLLSEKPPGSAPYTILYISSFSMFFGAALVSATQAGLILSWLVGCVYVFDTSVQIPYVDAIRRELMEESEVKVKLKADSKKTS